MHETCDSYRVKISGYLDGELPPDERAALEEHLARCEGCRREFHAVKSLVVGTAFALRAPEVPDAVWDGFLSGVYNRLERKTGWIILIAGMIALSLYGAVLFVTEPWAPALTKLLIAAPIVGAVLLFISVLRHRLHTIKTDRYTREVHR